MKALLLFLATGLLLTGCMFTGYVSDRIHVRGHEYTQAHVLTAPGMVLDSMREISAQGIPAALDTQTYSAWKFSLSGYRPVYLYLGPDRGVLTQTPWPAQLRVQPGDSAFRITYPDTPLVPSGKTARIGQARLELEPGGQQGILRPLDGKGRNLPVISEDAAGGKLQYYLTHSGRKELVPEPAAASAERILCQAYRLDMASDPLYLVVGRDSARLTDRVPAPGFCQDAPELQLVLARLGDARGQPKMTVKAHREGNHVLAFLELDVSNYPREAMVSGGTLTWPLPDGRAALLPVSVQIHRGLATMGGAGNLKYQYLWAVPLDILTAPLQGLAITGAWMLFLVH
jgi:hypothetical protein